MPAEMNSEPSARDKLEQRRYERAAANSQLAYSAAMQSGYDKQFAEDMQSVQAGYMAGSRSRYLGTPPGINPLGTNADYHYNSELQYFMMTERARFDDRDNMVLGQGITRMVANVLQNGFKLHINTGDSGLNRELDDRWDSWSGDKDACDFEGERTFDQIVRSQLRNTVVDGDIMSLPLESGQLQTLENHRCRTPWKMRGMRGRNATGVVHGVELANRRRVGFHFTKDELNLRSSVTRRTKMDRISARDDEGNRQVFQLYFPKRFSQTRGVTALAPICFPTKYHDDLQFANLVNAKRASFIAILRTMDPTVDPPSDRQSGTRETETRADGTTRTTEGGGPGQTIVGAPGEKLEAWSANIPAASFFDHAAMLLAIMAINLDLPELVFMLDGSKTNFNGYRAVAEQMRMRFEQIQSDIICTLHSPIYSWQVRLWAEADPAIRRMLTRSNINVFAHLWTPRGWPYVQPVTDAAADDLRTDANLCSQTERAQERGKTWKGPADYKPPAILSQADEIVDDREYIIRRAMARTEAIQEDYPKTGTDLNWRELAYGNRKTGIRMSLSGSLDDPDDGVDPKKPDTKPGKRPEPDSPSEGND